MTDQHKPGAKGSGSRQRICKLASVHTSAVSLPEDLIPWVKGGDQKRSKESEPTLGGRGEQARCYQNYVLATVPLWSVQRLDIYRMIHVSRPEADMRGRVALFWWWMSENCPLLDCVINYDDANSQDLFSPPSFFSQSSQATILIASWFPICCCDEIL